MDTFEFLMKSTKSGGGEDPIMKLMRLSAVQPMEILEKAAAKKRGDILPPPNPKAEDAEEAQEVEVLSLVHQPTVVGGPAPATPKVMICESHRYRM